ncbi:MAG: T9SS type A sorting domain-containing protein [Chitinophagales bacterium]
MHRIFTVLLLLTMVLMGSSGVAAQESKVQKEFRPVSIINDIDKPEGMAAIGNMLYIAQYHQNGSIVQYDIAQKRVIGKISEGLNYPSGLLSYKDKLIVLEFGTGSMYSVDPENGQKVLIATGFSRPADVVLFKDNLLVSDYGKGTIYAVNPDTNEKSVFATGLSSPAGLAIHQDLLHVVEWGMGRISKINEDGKKVPLVTEGLSTPWGLMVYENELYVAENGSNQISKIKEVKIPIANSKAVGAENATNVIQDSISVWKVISMDCVGLDHPEAFCVSDRGLYVSEWKSKEVSEIRLNSPPSGELLLVGKSKIGNILTAEPQDIQDEDGLGPFSYRWQIADFPESKVWEYLDGDKIEYKLKKGSLVGKFIRAELSYTDQKGFQEFVFSDVKEIIKTLAPMVTLSFYPENIYLPGDTVTIIAELRVLDEDAHPNKVEFFSDNVPLITVSSAPYTYRFVVQDNKTTKEYVDQISIIAKGYDSNNLFGKDEKTIYVTNEEVWKNELSALLNTSDVEMNIFPNPAEDIINLAHKEKQTIKAQLINLNKEVVLSIEINNGFKALDISKLPPGIYILEYTIGNETKAEKIIKL